MPEKTPSFCPKFSCQKKFTLASCQLIHINLHNPEQFQVAHQKDRSIRNTPRGVEPARCREFNSNNDSVEAVDALRYIEHLENIADSEFQPLPQSLPQTETYSGASPSLSNCIAEPWKRDAQGCHATNPESNPYNIFATTEEKKYIQCRTQKKGMKTYYDNIRKEENTTLQFAGFKKQRWRPEAHG